MMETSDAASVAAASITPECFEGGDVCSARSGWPRLLFTAGIGQSLNLLMCGAEVSSGYLDERRKSFTTAVGSRVEYSPNGF
jgi:hypothetical protein